MGGLQSQIDDLVDAVCEGQPCGSLPGLLDLAHQRLGNLTATMREKEEEARRQHEKDLADKSEAEDEIGRLNSQAVKAQRSLTAEEGEVELWKKRVSQLQQIIDKLQNATPAPTPAPTPSPTPAPTPAPSKCSGLVQLSGTTGHMSSGDEGPKNPDTCRWLITSPSDVIVLHFSGIQTRMLRAQTHTRHA